MSANEEKKVVNIKLEKLGIDVCNIREGSWNYDEEIVNSVKTRGIISPLTVRHVNGHAEGKEFGIICGSRRYHAALAAGLDKIPCFVEDMDDLEALSTSMIENRQRSDTPKWLDINSVGKIYHTLQEGSHEDKVDYIVDQTGISHPTIERYVKIYALPEEIKGLLRSSSERTKRQSEALLLYQIRASDKALPIQHAEYLVNLKNIDPERLMETAVFIMDKRSDVAEQLTNFVRSYPDRAIEEIYNEMIRKAYGTYDKSFRFDSETWHAIENACMDRQMPYDKYVKKILRERLHKDGYLGVKEAIDLEIADEEADFVIINCSRGILEKCDYKYLKNEGDKRIYQKPVGGGTGGFYKAFTKGHTSCIRLTPGNYDDEAECLKIEKKKLLEYKHNV